MNLKEKEVVIDNKTYRYSKIVMLPTNKENYNSNQLFIDNVFDKNELKYGISIDGLGGKHIYFLSTDKICKGDWFYDTRDRIVSNKCLAQTMFSVKIIASTNPSLNLPKPSKQFLQIYIFAYNKNEKIEECLVEYTKHFDEGWTDEGGAFEIEYKALKVTKGEITIRKVKREWSKEEMISKIKLFADNFVANTNTAYKQREINEWIEQNL